MKCSVEVITNKPVPVLQIEQLDGDIFYIPNGYITQINNDWHLLKIAYPGEELEIQDIKIDGVSIENILYTGYIVDAQGIVHQPATRLWSPETYYCIWIHPNFGIWHNRMFTEIAQGDFGSNLHKKYLFTVDRPLMIDGNYPTNVQGFFAKGDGPHYWKLNDETTPYQLLNFDVSHKTLQAINQLSQEFEQKHFSDEWTYKTFPIKTALATPQSLDIVKNPVVKKLLEDCGYKKILNFSILDLEPKSYIKVHLDDFTQSDVYQHIKGATKLYLSYNLNDEFDTNGLYFKLGDAGLLPLDKPLLVNTHKYVHTLINNSEYKRRAFIAYGTF